MAERAQHPPTPPSTLEAKQAGIAGQLKRKPQIQAVIEGSLESIKAIFEMDVVEHEWGSGIATKLELTWSAIENLWPPAADKPDLALEIYRSTCEKLDEIVFIALSATLSPNINDLLQISKSDNLSTWHSCTQKSFPPIPRCGNA